MQPIDPQAFSWKNSTRAKKFPIDLGSLFFFGGGMTKLTTHYIDFPVSACKGLAGLEKTQKGWLERNGKRLAAVSCNKHGMQVSYTITFTNGDEKTSTMVNEHVPFTYTFPQYGGRRMWFECPVCGRRCGKLYFSTRTACRRCLRLVYPCQMKGGHDKGWQLHSRWLSRIQDGRPRYMHWKTYHDLEEKIDAIATKQLIGISGMIEKMLRRYE